MEGRDPQRSGRADVAGPDTSALAWSIDVPAQPSFAQVAQAADGTSYIALEEGGVVAVSATGQIRWRFTPPVDRGPAPRRPSDRMAPFTSAPPTAPSSR